jgi:N-acetylglucosaminyldiphosphoundecaprenol N-acetyl-beta-D-mannosaminyltransferase
MATALEAIENWIARREAHYVCVTSIHGVIESQHEEALREIHNAAGLVAPDGMPLVWLSRLQGLKQVERVYGPDLMLAVCEMSVSRGYRHYLYGGAEGVPEQLAAALKRRFAGLQIVGTHSPPFRPLTAQEDEQTVTMINGAQADIVWIGLSTPKQERWMAAHVGRVTAPVLIGVGAAFDFLSGRKKQAPHWMRRTGLEWLFRLLTEPRRLWRRYLTSIPTFVFWSLLQALRLRRYEMQ